MRVLITGGAGFIGSAVIRQFISDTSYLVLNVDKLTYASNPKALSSIDENPRYHFAKVDICDEPALRKVIEEFRPDKIMHLAAESHVDRSIDSAASFIQTNVVGTCALLEAARSYWMNLPGAAREEFRFHHVSTDEVFGSLGSTGLFREDSPYDPSSPYSASKASSDHFVRAWQRTYGLPVITTNCSNNYGPFQFPEKLIPLIILAGQAGRPLPVYGTGTNVRDWLYVDDHATALRLALDKGLPGETYNIGGWNERTNLDVVQTICRLLDELVPDSPHAPHESLITYVQDRPGHDHRYAIDASKIHRQLGWKPRETFESGLRKTVQWYLEYYPQMTSESYEGERLGLSTKLSA